MEPESTETMTQFLTPTPLCDSDNAKIKDKAEELAKGRDPSEAAVSIFYFVRDKITFGLYYPDAKASTTLDHGSGFCMTKTNLQMALLRAAGIPSRCHLVQLPKEVNQAYIPAFFMNRTPDLIVHPWCECYLDGSWVACDSVLDEAMYRGMIGGGHLSVADVPSIDWDGRTDLVWGKPYIKADLGTFPSWDEGIQEAKRRGGVPPSNKLLGPIMFGMANRRIRDIRISAS
jgi:transglutaminase-like putative cysteine protease